LTHRGAAFRTLIVSELSWQGTHEGLKKQNKGKGTAASTKLEVVRPKQNQPTERNGIEREHGKGGSWDVPFQGRGVGKAGLERHTKGRAPRKVGGLNWLAAN